MPLDGSDYAKGALLPAAYLAAALAEGQGTLHLTQVVRPVTGSKIPARKTLNGFETQTDMQRARQYLDKTVEEILNGSLAPAINDLHLELTTSVALEEDVANAIIRVAENREDAEGASVSGRCDAIAMSTHGLGGKHHFQLSLPSLTLPDKRCQGASCIL